MGNRGFTFYGGFIFVALGLAVYVWRRRISLKHLDAIAVGLPLDMPSVGSRHHQRRSDPELVLPTRQSGDTPLNATGE